MAGCCGVDGATPPRTNQRVPGRQGGASPQQPFTLTAVSAAPRCLTLVQQAIARGPGLGFELELIAIVVGREALAERRQIA